VQAAGSVDLRAEYSTILLDLAVSDRMQAVNCSGVLPRMSMPTYDDVYPFQKDEDSK
jgi:hypothetical protein